MRSIKFNGAHRALQGINGSRNRPTTLLAGRIVTPAASRTLITTASSSSICGVIGPYRRPRLATSAPAALRSPPTRHASSEASTAPLQKTALHDLHVAHGAKVVPFGGYLMPVQYADQSVSASHNFTRAHASLFDVGHMVQRIIQGPGAALFLERITPLDARGLPPMRGSLSCLLHEGTGGIVDDTIVTRLRRDEEDDGKEGNHSNNGGGVFYVVTNAGCREKDDAYLGEQLKKWNEEPGHEALQVQHQKLDGFGLVALQGPQAEEVLRDVLAEPVNLREIYFGQAFYAKLKAGADLSSSSNVLISRGGYTGEDGFEISIEPQDTVGVTEALLAAGGPERVRLAGLGARDSLRLEAGLCLYGHDLDDSTTPVEAALSWIIPPHRRKPDAGFHGAEVIARQLVPRSKGGSGVHYRRVGLVVEGAPAREDAKILRRADGTATPEEADESIGTVTSGCPSPTLGKNIAMGYIKDGLHKAGTEVDVLVRGKRRKAVVTKMPFVPTKYWKGPAA